MLQLRCAAKVRKELGIKPGGLGEGTPCSQPSLSSAAQDICCPIDLTNAVVL